MAKAPALASDSATAAASAVVALADDGYLRIYSGSKPATADTAVTTQTLLAELRLANPAGASVTDGVVTFGTITPDASANATGTATWFRVLASDGSSSVFDGTVGTSTSDLILGTTSITTGATVAVTSFTYTQPKA